MKKVFLFASLCFLSSTLFASYTIKIAVYKDHDNLMRFIAKVPKAEYRKNIIITKKNHLNYVTSISYAYEKEVQKALRAYKKVFPDAFIEENEDVKPNKAPSVKKPIEAKPTVAKSTPKKSTIEQQEENITKKAPFQEAPLVQNTIDEGSKTPEPKEEKAQAVIPPLPIYDAKTLLLGKRVYLCKEEPLKRSRKGIIQLDFKEGYALYSKVSKTVAPIEIPYLFDLENVTFTLSDIAFKYQILKEEKDFLSVQSYVNNKKGQKFRFYFDENLVLDFAGY